MHARPALTRYPTAGTRMECSTGNASNVMPQILVGVRSSIGCRSSTRHLVKVSQVFCGACTGQRAPSRKPTRGPGVHALARSRSDAAARISRANRGRNRSLHPRRDTKPSARYAYDAVAFASRSHRACPKTLISPDNITTGLIKGVAASLCRGASARRAEDCSPCRLQFTR